jgi:hypothetical protein
MNNNEGLLNILKAEFLAVDKVGHFAYYERPEVVYPRLVDFLGYSS